MKLQQQWHAMLAAVAAAAAGSALALDNGVGRTPPMVGLPSSCVTRVAHIIGLRFYNIILNLHTYDY